MAPKSQGLEHKYRMGAKAMVRDTRPMTRVFIDFLKQPETLFVVALLGAGLSFVFPMVTEGIFLLVLIYLYFFTSIKARLPLKMPKQAAIADPGDPKPGSGKPGPADGIFFLGNDQEDNDELWITNSDARTHMLVLGTTGSGKTETLISMSANALAWGSGLLYTDGKGDSSLWGKIYSLSRRFGRDDDVLLINFMTGNSEGRSGSNTLNPFYSGSSSAITEMLVSLMDDAGQEGAMWKGRAIAMLTGVMLALVELRDSGKLLLDVNSIRNHLALPKIIEMYFDPQGTFKLSNRARNAVKGYLDSLPGFEWAEAEAGRPQPGTANDQHGYLYMQFTRIMMSLGETYGYIFNCELGDVDFLDVVVNRRILAVLLPALEKSSDELANLGKIIVTALKGMMSTTLGAAVEGDWGDVIETKPTNSPTPFLAILDEVGYYTVDGMAVMAAQARSLGFSLVFAAQDLAAMKKRSAQEADSIIANTNLKAFMKLEDEGETKELFIKLGGKVVVSQSGGMSRDITQMVSGFYDTQSTSYQVLDLEAFMSAREQLSGQAYIATGGKMLRTNMFFANPKSAKRLRYNRFIQVRSPDAALLTAGTVDGVLRNLRDDRFSCESAEPMRDANGEIAIAVQTLEKAKRMKAVPRVVAAVAAVHRSLSTEDPYEALPDGVPTDMPDGVPAARRSAGGLSDSDGVTLRKPTDDQPQTLRRKDRPGAAAASGANGSNGSAKGANGANGAPNRNGRQQAASAQHEPAPVLGAGGDEDLFARLWGSASNDVIGGIQSLAASAAEATGRSEPVLETVANAIDEAMTYPDGPPPPRQLEEAILGAILHLQDVLREGIEAAEGAGADEDVGDFDWNIDTDWSVEGEWSAGGGSGSEDRPQS